MVLMFDISTKELKMPHPETGAGEVYYGNNWDGEFPSVGYETVYTPNGKFKLGTNGGTNLQEIGWQKKRLGTVAYDRDGNIINDARPIFLTIEEIGEEIAKRLTGKDNERKYPNR